MSEKPKLDEPGEDTESAPSKASAWKIIGVLAVLAVLAVIGYGAGVVMHAFKPLKGEVNQPSSLSDIITNIGQVAVDPKQGFPEKSKVVIACMGIDDNWTNSDIEYTAGARTDTLFLLTLDLDSRKATMLSIPRDSYVPIAGTDYSDKINAAYSTGGPKRTEATIENWVGVNPDYYVVLNIDATKRMVDALGGVDVNVEHKMDYDDAWGQLHVHLLPGFQHLDGDQAVGFARYRHGNRGVTPEDGDERRMYRQHVLFKAMMAKAKSFSTILQANNLIDTAMSCIRTNMTRTQLFDLAALFHNADQDTDVTTASLDGEDGRGPNGVYVMMVDQKIAKEYVSWLVDGDESAARELTRVRIANATTTPGLAAQASKTIENAGYSDTQVTTVLNGTAPKQTEIIDTGVDDHAAASEVASALGMPSAPIIHQPVQPNRFGWTAPPEVKVILGPDFSAPSPQQTAANPG